MQFLHRIIRQRWLCPFANEIWGEIKKLKNTASINILTNFRNLVTLLVVNNSLMDSQ